MAEMRNDKTWRSLPVLTSPFDGGESTSREIPLARNGVGHSASSDAAWCFELSTRSVLPPHAPDRDLVHPELLVSISKIWRLSIGTKPRAPYRAIDGLRHCSPPGRLGLCSPIGQRVMNSDAYRTGSLMCPCNSFGAGWGIHGRCPTGAPVSLSWWTERLGAHHVRALLKRPFAGRNCRSNHSATLCGLPPSQAGYRWWVQALHRRGREVVGSPSHSLCRLPAARMRFRPRMQWVMSHVDAYGPASASTAQAAKPQA